MAISQTAEDGENFRFDLAHLMLTQKACFNSPVWFNVGVKEARGYGWILRTRRATGGQAGSRRGAAAVLRLFHFVSVKDSLEIHSRSGQDRRHAVQVGFGHGIEPLRAAARRTPCSQAAAAPPGRSRS